MPHLFDTKKEIKQQFSSQKLTILNLNKDSNYNLSLKKKIINNFVKKIKEDADEKAEEVL